MYLFIIVFVLLSVCLSPNWGHISMGSKFNVTYTNPHKSIYNIIGLHVYVTRRDKRDHLGGIFENKIISDSKYSEFDDSKNVHFDMINSQNDCLILIIKSSVQLIWSCVFKQRQRCRRVRFT